MVRRKTVTIPGRDLGVSVSRNTKKSAFAPQNVPSKRPAGKNGSLRSSTIQRSHRSSIYVVHKKWRLAQRAVVMSNPHYEGSKMLCYLYLLLQFLFTYLTIWRAKKQISTRVVRKMVVCQIIGLIIMGFLFSTGGVFNISVFSKNTNQYTKDFYWAMTIVSMVVFVLSVLGCIGIFRPNMFITQIYAVVSFIFGHLIFSVVLAWYLLVSLDAYLSDTYFHGPGTVSSGNLSEPVSTELLIPVEPSAANKMDIFNYRLDKQIFNDELLRNYCLMLLFVSIIMMSSGVLTTKLLIQVRRKQGYFYVVETTGDSTSAELSNSFTRNNLLY